MNTYLTCPWDFIDELEVDGIDWTPYVKHVYAYTYVEPETRRWLHTRIEAQVVESWARVLFDQAPVTTTVVCYGDGLAYPGHTSTGDYEMHVNGTYVTFTSNRPEAQK